MIIPKGSGASVLCGGRCPLKVLAIARRSQKSRSTDAFPPLVTAPASGNRLIATVMGARHGTVRALGQGASQGPRPKLDRQRLHWIQAPAQQGAGRQGLAAGAQSSSSRQAGPGGGQSLASDSFRPARHG